MYGQTLVCVNVANSTPSLIENIFSGPKYKWGTRIYSRDTEIEVSPYTCPFAQCSLPKLLLMYTFASPIITPRQMIAVGMRAGGT